MTLICDQFAMLSCLQAVALEKRVYQVLEATPQQGKDFAKAVREVLRRETTWVEWKKGKPLGKTH